MTESPRDTERPVGGPVVPDPWVQNARGGRAGRATRGTTLGPSRVSSAALHHLIARLTPVDRSILSLVRRLKLVSGSQVTRYIAAGEGFTPGQSRVMRRRLERLTTWRVLDRLPRAIGGASGGSGSWVYVVGPVGRRILTREGVDARRTRTPGARYVDHAMATAELAVALHEFDAHGDLELLEWDAEPDSWVPFPGQFGGQRMLKPDLYISVAAGDEHYDRWWIEMDRETEQLPRVLDKCLFYLACMRGTPPKDGAHPRVLWVVPTDRRADQIRDLIASLPPGDQPSFAAIVLEDAPSFIAAQARL